MPMIRQMDQRLANMIAAGEVVDRPASIVKELVENSIDAKATSISVEVFDMGMSLIRVIDNGIGMDQEDAHLAFHRHATSKIKDEFDLGHIKTLGFRGEALAAIASVSKVTLKTRQEDHEGFMVYVEGGHFIKDGLAMLNRGTIVEVKDLFYNTPARFKYIKSDLSEKTMITDIFDRLALAHPEIRFQLYIDQKLMKETYGNLNFFSLIDQIYGPRMTKGMITFKEIVQKMTIEGYLLSPSIARSRKKDISIFVNGRFIKNYALIQAVVDGYHSYMMVGKFPIAMIHITLDPSLLDVNVHPQKYEVKFVNEMILAYHIEGFVKKALMMEKHDIPQGLESIHKAMEPSEVYTPLAMSFDNIFLEENDLADDMPHKRLPELLYVGTFAGTYLLFQNEEGLFLVDQHAAAERVRYEHYTKALAHPTFATKMMFISHPLSITSEDKAFLLSHRDQLKKFGFEWDQSQELISIPTWLEEDEIELALESMATMLEEKNTIDLSHLRDSLAKDVSCKGAIKANKALSILEINHLMNELSSCENPYHCPHGRPTIVRLTNYDIERMFKRVV
ncbi:MAG: DNA mismatch repair endonuclease MutL [Acholeplasma sp.]|jgi:DNA mismatch repair protein MutL|nr:MAG: DNA mismatch repair endonuclease MutL [Acholeplasma sp.]